MKPGRASQTAVLVCMARAAAHGMTSVASFSDPTALWLLPDAERQRVESLRQGVEPQGWRARQERVFLEKRSKMMVARTVAIDEAVRSAAAPQLVILGAGLDGRAWRMPELGDVVVFEVDHPDSQREKRERAARLTPTAREIRFVPVDFRAGTLDVALSAAGHDPLRPTTWIWEGVVMYLKLADIEATLAALAARSAPGSRLVVVYHSSAALLWLVGLVLRRIGEPLRSVFSATEMRALLAKYTFDVVRDEALPLIGARLSSDVAQATRIMKHMRIATAERLAPAPPVPVQHP
jgi:methyltransferase (TIGR00027 family)